MPSEKRARQRARRDARMAELRRAQQRRRNTRLGGVGAIIVVVAVVLALATGGVFGGGSSKKSTKVTTAGAPTSGALTATAAAALNTVAAPATSSTCNVAQPTASTTTTTVPARGNAVATIEAPSATMPFPNLNGSSPHYTKFQGPPPFCIDVTKTYTAVVKTDVGTMTIELLPANAPQTVNSFVFLAGYHYFDGTVFHRAIPGFVDQGGDPTGTGTGGPGYTFADELPKSNAAYDQGALAMANSGPNTNGSQFFLVMAGGGKQLQASYSMFGQITSGINVMDKINADGGTLADNGTPPRVTHHIISVTIEVGSAPTTPTTTATTTGSSTTAPSTTTTTAPTTTAPATTAATSATTASTAPSTTSANT